MKKRDYQITAETARAFQELARHQLIEKIYQEILFDMKVCEIEGWDKFEFIEQLQDVINHFKKK